jgi:uncharacterized protein YaiI (UPF0178 family)
MVFVDADACPVREEAIRVALRHKIGLRFVANQYLRLPDHILLAMHLVGDGFDAADDAIIAGLEAGDIVVTGDILLAERALKSGAHVISPKGDAYTMDTIGAQVATRALMADLRAGLPQESAPSGPHPFTKADRSRFLERLDLMLRRAK